MVAAFSRFVFRHSLLRSSLAAAAAILFLPLTVPLLTGRVFPLGDLSSFQLPMRFLYQQALAGGDAFLWTPALESGLYLHAEGQAGMAHPWHLALYWLLPLGPAFNAEMLGTYLFAATGMWLLLREFGLPRAAALAGALAFAFSGFNVMHLLHMNLMAVLAHLPWVLFASSVLLTAATAARAAAAFAGLAALIGSELLLGFPQGVWMTSLAVAWLAVYRVIAGTALTRLVWLAMALGCGLLIGAVQLLPTFDATLGSFRARPALDFRLTFSMHPINLVQLWSPYTLDTGIYATVPSEWLPHEFGIYNGAFSTLSLFWIGARLRVLRRRRLAIACLCLAGLGIVLSLGRYGGLYTLLAYLPGISSFRASTRHIVLVHLAFAMLAALMLEDLLDLRRRAARLSYREMWPIALSIAITIGVLIAGLLSAGSTWASAMDLRLERAGPALVGAAAALATAAAIVAGARGWRAAVPVVIVLAALDLAWWGTRYVYSEPPVPIERIAPPSGLPMGAEDQDLVDGGRSLDAANLFPMWGLRSARAYLGIPQSPVLARGAPITLRVAGARWRLAPGGWTAVEGAMPRARMVSDWSVSENVRADIARVDIARTVLVDVPPGETSGRPGSARIVHQRPGAFRIDTDAPGPQLLVVAERFHSGWRASIGGQIVPVYRAYGDYMAIRVPAGAHQVALTFAPASARWGLILTLVGLCATVLGATLVRRGAAGFTPGGTARAS